MHPLTKLIKMDEGSNFYHYIVGTTYVGPITNYILCIGLMTDCSAVVASPHHNQQQAQITPLGSWNKAKSLRTSV